MRKSSPSPKLSPTEFEPELVSTLRSVLEAAVDQIDKAHRTPEPQRRKWLNASFGPHQMA